jgi:chromosome segregation ATPase
MKSQIQAQKSRIAELQKQIDELDGSIRFAPGNCVRNCEQWNEHQQQKQQQVEQMRTQLEEQKKQLDEMQESARKQGFGSSVYEP